MNAQLELAYLAGAMDADGFISMTKRTLRGCTTYSEFIGLAQVTDTVPMLLRSLFGGYIQLRKRADTRAANWRPIYYWAATTRNAANAIKALRPYLKVKTEQADLVLALRRSKELPAKRRRAVRVGVRAVALNPEVVAEREAFYAKIKRLNHNGIH